MHQLLEKLVNIPSVTDDELHVADFLSDYMQQSGYQIYKQQVSQNRYNIIGTTGQTPVVLFCTHLDTVAPFIPFKNENGLLTGRGTCDAKGILVTMLEAAKRLQQEGEHRFGFAFVVGEEKKSDGAKKAAELNLGSRAVIIGEPTQSKLAVGQKGVLLFRVRAKGIAGHSAYPQKGDSAIHRLISLLNHWVKLDWGQDSFFGKNTLNIGKLYGGSGANVIADHADAEGIFRVATSLSTLKDILNSVTDEHIEINISSETNPQHLGKLDGFEPTIVSFGSDAAYMKPLGTIYELGPGSIEFAHSDHEQITINEMEQAVPLYIKMVKQILSL